jgi:hypothetical protein
MNIERLLAEQCSDLYCENDRFSQKSFFDHFIMTLLMGKANIVLGRGIVPAGYPVGSECSSVVKECKFTGRKLNCWHYIVGMEMN